MAAELELAGDHSQLVAELEALTAAHPLRERLRVLLIKALHADGRQSEALAAFEDYRRLLIEELGSDPGAELQEAHLAVLRGEQPRAAGSWPARHSTRYRRSACPSRVRPPP